MSDSELDFPRFFPRIIERCLVIPLVTIVLVYPSYAILGLILATVLGISTLGGLIMIDPIIVKEATGIGVVVVMTAILFIFSFLNRLGKQKTQAKTIEIKMSHGYEPTIDELLDMEKVKTVNKIYKIALVFGIVIAATIGSLVTYFILMPIESDAKYYFMAFAVSFICYIMVDYVVKSVANGEFEKCKQEMLEQFRKVEEPVEQTPLNNADMQNFQSQLASMGQMMSQMAQMFGKH